MPIKLVNDDEYVYRTLKPEFTGKFEGQIYDASTSKLVRINKDKIESYKGFFVEDEQIEKPKKFGKE